MTGPTGDRTPVVLVVDTGTDDAGAILWAATDPRVELVAVVSDWGNVDVDQRKVDRVPGRVFCVRFGFGQLGNLSLPSRAVALQMKNNQPAG